MRLSTSLLCCLLVLAGCSQQETQTPGAGAATLFEGARLIIGDGSAPIENSAFVIENNQFTQVGRSGEVEAPEGAARVDLAGKTVMPALIDAHTHLGWTILGTNSIGADTYTRENLIDHLRREAYYGVGAAMSMGIDPGEIGYEIRANPVAGAALFRLAGRGLARPNAGPGAAYWRPIAYGLDTEEQARAAVRELAAAQVDLIKIWVDDRNGTVPKLGPELYRAAIDEAHKAGLRVAAHIFYLADAKELLRAGIDGFAHGVRDRDVDEEFMTLIQERTDVFVIPNLPDRGNTAEYVGFLGETMAPDQVRRIREESAEPLSPRARELFDVQARNLAKLSAAGVRIAFGTDSSAEVGWYAHQEMADMVAAGMTPAEVIVAATRTSAEILRLDDHGTVEQGKSASFIVLDANPLDDIDNTRRISQVYLRGQEIDRSTLTSSLTTP